MIYKGKKRKYHRIFAIIGSYACSILWVYIAIRFTVTDRSPFWPMIAATIFGFCAIMETVTYIKYGNAWSHFHTCTFPIK